MRLIDADNIRGRLEYIKINEYFEPYIMLDNLVKLLDEQPTAYDVDKVVEELQKESYAIMLDGALVASKEVVIDAKRATEIVMQGGVSNTSGEREIARLCDYAIAENMILTGKP